ncbi:hypothetical protein Tco_0240925 [Tanacetum coccineum]
MSTQTPYVVTKQKVSQKFSHGSSISFPTLTADNTVVEPLTIEINAAGHDIHRMYIDGGASADILYEHSSKDCALNDTRGPIHGPRDAKIPRRRRNCHHLQRGQGDGDNSLGQKASLKIRPGYSPVRQKKRGQAPERTKAILEEVHKLVEAGIMREVYYHDWLSNPVMVKKSDGSWRMCVDFTDLNKACSRIQT